MNFDNVRLYHGHHSCALLSLKKNQKYRINNLWAWTRFKKPTILNQDRNRNIGPWLPIKNKYIQHYPSCLPLRLDDPRFNTAFLTFSENFIGLAKIRLNNLSCYLFAYLLLNAKHESKRQMAVDFYCTIVIYRIYTNIGVIYLSPFY